MNGRSTVTQTQKNSSWRKVLESRFFIGEQIPTSGQELSARLTESFRVITGGKALPADGIRATITSPPNVELLQADLSGLDLDIDDSTIESAKGQISSDTQDVADRVPAKIHKAMVKAHPLKVRAIPVEFDLQVEHVPFNWIIDKTRKVWFGLATETPQGMTGEFTGRIEKTALKRAVQEAVAVGAEQKGFKLADLDFDITQTGQEFLVAGSAKLRKGILAARADARAVVQYDPAKLQLTIKTVDLHSPNPAIGMILRMADGAIARYRGKTIDLNEMLSPTGQKLSTLEIIVSRSDVKLHGKF